MKNIRTAVVGVFGLIAGFYFGYGMARTLYILHASIYKTDGASWFFRIFIQSLVFAQPIFFAWFCIRKWELLRDNLLDYKSFLFNYKFVISFIVFIVFFVLGVLFTHFENIIIKINTAFKGL